METRSKAALPVAAPDHAPPAASGDLPDDAPQFGVPAGQPGSAFFDLINAVPGPLSSAASIVAAARAPLPEGLVNLAPGAPDASLLTFLFVPFGASVPGPPAPFGRVWLVDQETRFESLPQRERDIARGVLHAGMSVLVVGADRDAVERISAALLRLGEIGGGGHVVGNA